VKTADSHASPSLLFPTRRQFLGSASAAVLMPSASALAQTPKRSRDGFLVITAEQTTAPLLGNKSTRTPVWGYNGSSPGPLIRVKQGEKVKVRLVNKLDQPTSIHWHGIRIDNAMDGVTGLTQKAVKPGQTFDYEFVARDAGTYWYHTHNRSWEQLARGLYGMLIVDEPVVTNDKEINIVLDDWRIADDGTIDERSMGDLHDWAHGGRLGNVLTVNGRAQPEFSVNSGERLRMRIVNVANSRIMELAIPNHEPWLVALDGHPIPPRKLEKADLILGPAQRIDLLVDAKLEPGSRSPIEFVSERQKFPVAQLNYTSTRSGTAVSDTAPASLPVSMPHRAFNPAKARIVKLKMIGGAMGSMNKAMLGGKTLNWKQLVKARRVWAFNGIAGDLDKPLIDVRRGETVRIDIINDTAFPHAMHLHGTHFTVVARNKMSVANRIWRDTEVIYPDERVSFAFLADNPGKWLFHCHMIEHQAGGMMTWINVM
jgi:FtsP/CotA-like multicopper oxidase with cupredoxin domain